jgi:acyl-CoA synthetase (AMP-forming)/AMP-acid ligase II
MGLIDGLVLPVATGAKSVLMAPPAFLQRPIRWLEAIGEFTGAKMIHRNGRV